MPSAGRPVAARHVSVRTVDSCPCSQRLKGQLLKFADQPFPLLFPQLCTKGDGGALLEKEADPIHRLIVAMIGRVLSDTHQLPCAALSGAHETKGHPSHRNGPAHHDADVGEARHHHGRSDRGEKKDDERGYRVPATDQASDEGPQTESHENQRE